MRDYMHSVVERRRSVAVFEGLGIYRDAMRMFIRDNITTEIGTDLDEQIFSALPPPHREELAIALDSSPGLAVVYAIDTKHFPRLVQRYWYAFGRHFDNDREYLHRMKRLNDIRNRVCHPEMRDVSSRCAQVCFRDVKLIVKRTGPDEACEMVEAIEDRLFGMPKEVEGLVPSDTEFNRVFKKVWSDVGEVSEIVEGLVDDHSNGHDGARFAMLRRAGGKLADGSRMIGDVLTRVRKR